jgi:2-haloacid dehalogenase
LTQDAAMLDLSQYKWLSFDCYGTLIDWESGILGYLRPLLRRHGRHIDDNQILHLYSEFEPREQAGEYRRYREVLAEAAGLAESILHWQPFSDTVPALRALHARFKLAVLSNIDRDLFAYSALKLEVPFDLVVTAEDARGYKPSIRNFELLLQKLPVPQSQLLHVAESLFHDVAPARSLGIATVWVNRRQGKPAAASKLVAAQPDLEVQDLSALVKLFPEHTRTD